MDALVKDSLLQLQHHLEEIHRDFKSRMDALEGRQKKLLIAVLKKVDQEKIDDILRSLGVKK